MRNKPSKTTRKKCLIIVAALAALGSGCGDGWLQRQGGTFDRSLSRQIAARIGNTDVELLEYAGCKVVAGEDPEARCNVVSNTQVEIFVEGQSLIFDFSNVENAGTASDGELAGYVLVPREHSRMPRIVQAIVDAAQSSVSAREVDLQFDQESVVVNLDGLDYDDSTFIKIDLLFEEAS